MSFHDGVLVTLLAVAIVVILALSRVIVLLTRRKIKKINKEIEEENKDRARDEVNKAEGDPMFKGDFPRK